MPLTIIADDTRFGSRTPVSFPSSISLHVDDGTPLNAFIERLRSIINIHGPVSTLYVIAQAVEQVFAGESDGGDGILFCREHMSAATVDRFSVLSGLVDTIMLVVCTPLPTTFDVYVGENSDPRLLENEKSGGDEIARRLALATGARVISAREPRHFSAEAFCSSFAGYEITGEGELIDHSSWNATVTEYTPDGLLNSEHVYVADWKDGFGSLQDPRAA